MNKERNRVCVLPPPSTAIERDFGDAGVHSLLGRKCWSDGNILVTSNAQVNRNRRDDQEGPALARHTRHTVMIQGAIIFMSIPRVLTFCGQVISLTPSMSWLVTLNLP